MSPQPLPPETLPRFGTRMAPNPTKAYGSHPRRDYSSRKGPSHTIPACQRGNNRLHSRGRGCPRVDHLISTSPPMLSQGLSCAHRGGRQTNTCHDIITRLPYPPLVKGPVGGIGSIWGTSVRLPLPSHVFATMGPSKVLI